MEVSVPDDILYLIAGELGRKGDFQTLFRCALTNSNFAEPALKTLYRLSDIWSSTATDEGHLYKEIAPVRCRQALLWHSIIASTFGRTYLPYCRFVCVINYDVLYDILLGLKYSGKIKNLLFSARHDILNFLLDYTKIPKPPGPTASLHIEKTIKKIGDAITAKSSSLEEIYGCPSNRALVQWICRSPRLRRLRLSGDLPPPKKLGAYIRKYCPGFNDLYLFKCTNDHRFAKLAAKLRPETLKYLVLEYNLIGDPPIRALGSQAASLVKLSLSSLTPHTHISLTGLGALQNLRELELSSCPPPPEKEASKVVASVSEWICSCKNLEVLKLQDFLDPSAIATRVILDKSIRLTHLTVRGYVTERCQAFHKSLKNQPALKTLELESDAEELHHDNALLLRSIFKLTHLENLELKYISQYFTQDDTVSLTTHLPGLVDLSTDAILLDDSIWEHFLRLPNLRRLELYAHSNFTPDGIVKFISQLENKNFRLVIMSQDKKDSIPKEAQTLIDQTLLHKLQGSFYFEPCPDLAHM